MTNITPLSTCRQGPGSANLRIGAFCGGSHSNGRVNGNSNRNRNPANLEIGAPRKGTPRFMVAATLALTAALALAPAPLHAQASFTTGSTGASVTPVAGEPLVGSSSSNAMSVAVSIDATTQSGADMCAKISSAWSTLVALNATGGIVDARGFSGTQNCAGSMWTNYPYAPSASQATTFCGKLLTAGVQIVTAVSQVMPSCALWDGSSTHAWPAPVNTAVGTTIQPANGFTASTPIIDYGQSSGAGSSPTDGIFIENLAVSCEQPNTTTVTGGIGIRNEYAQEGSGGNHIFIQGCNGVGLQIFTAGTMGGAQNSGAWSDIHINMSGVTTTAAKCLSVGGATHATGPIEGIHGISCVGQTSTRPLVGISLDGINSPLYDFHVENVVTGVEVGASNNASAIIINGYCVIGMTTCVHIASTNTVNSVNISGIAADSSTVTNILKDDNVNGGTALTSTETYLGEYARQSNNHVTSTLSSIPSTNMAFACAPKFSTSDTLTNSVTTQQFFATNCAIPANYFVANKALKIYLGVDFQSTAINSTFDLLLCTVSGCGSGTVLTLYSGANTDVSVGSKHSGGMMFLLQGTAAAGGSVALEATPLVGPVATSSSAAPFFGSAQATQVSAVPTNGILYLSVSIAWSSTTGTNSATVTQLATENLN